MWKLELSFALYLAMYCVHLIISDCGALFVYCLCNCFFGSIFSVLIVSLVVLQFFFFFWIICFTSIVPWYFVKAHIGQVHVSCTIQHYPIPVYTWFVSVSCKFVPISFEFAALELEVDWNKPKSIESYWSYLILTNSSQYDKFQRWNKGMEGGWSLL